MKFVEWNNVRLVIRSVLNTGVPLRHAPRSSGWGGVVGVSIVAGFIAAGWIAGPFPGAGTYFDKSGGLVDGGAQVLGLLVALKCLVSSALLLIVACMLLMDMRFMAHCSSLEEFVFGHSVDSKATNESVVEQRWWAGIVIAGGLLLRLLLFALLAMLGIEAANTGAVVSGSGIIAATGDVPYPLTFAGVLQLLRNPLSFWVANDVREAPAYSWAVLVALEISRVVTLVLAGGYAAVILDRVVSPSGRSATANGEARQA